MAHPIARQRRAQGLFTRAAENPILTADRWPYPASGVFNPGATQWEGGTLLLVRVEDLRGYSHFTAARSSDGRTGWAIDPVPTMLPDPSHHEEGWGIEDPRIVWLETHQQYAITYVSFSPGGPLVSLALTGDFRHFERLGRLTTPEDKDASLFPRKIGGRYALIHRPIIRGEAHIWISFSPDLRHWGDHQVLLPTRPGSWDAHHVGLGPPPVETPEGWLLVYHGARVTASSTLYRVGLALLDLDDPRRVLHRSEEWVLSPKEPYERIGDVPDVVFPTGLVWDKQTDEVRLYYGTGDDGVALATGRMQDVLAYLRECPA